MKAIDKKKSPESDSYKTGQLSTTKGANCKGHQSRFLKKKAMHLAQLLHDASGTWSN